MIASFTPSHRGGSGPPLVCLPGFTDTWRTWELVLPRLEHRHDVLAVTLAGHAGGPPLEGELSDALAGAVERAMDEAGLAPIWRATRSAATSPCSSPRAAAPSRSWRWRRPGGWATGDESYEEVLGLFTSTQEQLRALAPHADAIAATPEGRRRATQLITTNSEHLPPELVAHLILGAARCTAAPALIEHAMRAGWPLDAERYAAPSGSSGARPTGSSRGRLRPRAIATTGCPTPTGSSSTASGTARSSISRSRPRSSSSASRRAERVGHHAPDARRPVPGRGRRARRTGGVVIVLVGGSDGDETRSSAGQAAGPRQPAAVQPDRAEGIDFQGRVSGRLPTLEPAAGQG